MRLALRCGWILYGEPDHQDGRRFFAATGVFRRQRATQQRGESFFRKPQTLVFPALRNDGQIAFELRYLTLLIIAIVRRLSGADFPENAVAFPLQASKIPALSFGAVLADKDIAAILKAKFLPARIGCQRKVDRAAVLQSEEHTSELQSLTNLVC